MKVLIVMVTAAGLALAADGPGEDAAKAELERLQGTWQLASAETDGKKAPEDQIAKVRVVIRGNKHTVHVGDQVAAKEIPFTLDPSKTPKTVDDRLPDGREVHGIYELDGDTLKSCVAAVGQDRPTE